MLLQRVFTKSRPHQITKSVSADIISRASIKICNYLNIQAAKLVHLIIFLTHALKAFYSFSSLTKKNVMICRIAETLNNDNGNAKRHDENGNSLYKNKTEKNAHHHHYYYCEWLRTLNRMCVHFNEMVESSYIGSKFVHSKQTHSVWKCVQLWINISWWSRILRNLPPLPRWERKHWMFGKVQLNLFLSLVSETKNGVKLLRMGSQSDNIHRSEVWILSKYTTWNIMLATEQPMHEW